jgi:enoyl-CoA hydratase/carnithine racemase
MPTLDRHDDVFVLDLGGTENRFGPDWLDDVNAALDEIGRSSGARALVTAATGKFWSNGLDLDWIGQHEGAFEPYVVSVQALFARFLSLPLITVAALQGHCFAAGAMLSLCHDFRVMRADRGFWCLPEVDIAIPFSPGMSALLQARLSPQVAHEAMTTGRRYGGAEAQARGIVDRAVAEDAVRPEALALAATLAAKASPTLGTIKTRLYGPVLAALRDEDHPLG